LKWRGFASGGIAKKVGALTESLKLSAQEAAKPHNHPSFVVISLLNETGRDINSFE
jgi:hypothetical protein